jgi:hypothetical protein
MQWYPEDMQNIEDTIKDAWHVPFQVGNMIMVLEELSIEHRGGIWEYETVEAKFKIIKKIQPMDWGQKPETAVEVRKELPDDTIEAEFKQIE